MNNTARSKTEGLSMKEALARTEIEIKKNGIRQLACDSQEMLKALKEERRKLECNKKLFQYYAGKGSAGNVFGGSFSTEDIRTGMDTARKLSKTGSASEKRRAAAFIKEWSGFYEMIEQRSDENGIEYAVIGGIPGEELING